MVDGTVNLNSVDIYCRTHILNINNFITHCILGEKGEKNINNINVCSNTWTGNRFG